jgi:hypothetical protein
VLAGAAVGHQAAPGRTADVSDTEGVTFGG